MSLTPKYIHVGDWFYIKGGEYCYFCMLAKVSAVKLLVVTDTGNRYSDDSFPCKNDKVSVSDLETKLDCTVTHHVGKPTWPTAKELFGG